MAEIETMGILDEVQSIVSDKLQVVSYKWLSRNFLVSSNAAKGLLQAFVDKYGNGLEVIYSLSGWLKNNPSAYHIRLVSKDKLSDAKQEFEGNCSIQVYSVQACLPKDPATLWNHEFVQAEDLFKQSLAVDNCLRDNRFCGVSNSFVKRAVGGANSGTGTLQVKPTGGSVGSTSFGKPLQPPESAKTVKNESLVKLNREQGAQLRADKEKVPQVTRNNKSGQTDKKTSGSGGALAGMWGRASAKPEPEAALLQANNSKQNSAASAEAQICARESVEDASSDEDGHDFNMKRTSNGESSRKRRVVFDYSDEEDEYQEAVNLASPDPPKKSSPCLKDGLNAFGPECKLSFNDKEHKPSIKEAKADGEKTNQHSKETKIEAPTSDKNLSHVHKAESCVKDTVANVAPKRKKVLKTRIDDRGREVTEVVWEGEEPDRKSDDSSVKVAEMNTTNNATNRPPVVKKSPAVTTTVSNQTGKAGNKKGAKKDPKQGNIMSFFKKV
ncbi:DNA polymerase delta subunit [Striga asiatica]|uniref:DNA polymerase delta subunit 3 n=1 Tax=Striga asiatica TaxID=4170 RepID=A0A5A7PL57_STRAF|nr:DNA polymerase delta subunit [Striga asiatica]